MLFMTPNVVRNFLSKKATRLYPFEVRDPFAGYRGELVNDIETCILCSMCAKKCPSQCITVDREKGTWECDPYACIYCSVCVDNCPTNCLSMRNVHRKPAVAKEMYSLANEIRKKADPKVKATSKAKAEAAAKDEPEAAPAAEAQAPTPAPEEAPAKKPAKGKKAAKDEGGE